MTFDSKKLAVNYKVAMEVATHEGIIRQAYKDSVGVWTWSVGLTNATGHNVERYIGKPQSLEHCLKIYVWALENYADAVRETFKGHTLSEAQFAAALSFHWNTGAIKRASWVKQWKAGQIAKAKVAFMNWNKPSEIIPRRTSERDLFFDGKWSQNGTMTEFTKLTSRKTPVWSSARKIDVSVPLKRAMDVHAPQEPVQPDPVPPPPDSPAQPNTPSQPPQSGFFVALFSFLAPLVRRVFAR